MSIEIVSAYTTYFTAKVTSYYTEQQNKDISKVETNYRFNITASILEKPFELDINKLDGDAKKRSGAETVYDLQNRAIVDGIYTGDFESGEWTYRFYDQNLYYVRNYDDLSKPWLFYTMSGEPFTGKFTRTETNNGRSVTAVYKIKKSLIEDISYNDPATGKTISKEKYKDGLKKM